MNEATDADRALNERVANIPRNLHEMDLAIREALIQHKRAGNPVAVWRNERVEWIQPEDIPVDDSPDRGGM